MKIGREDRGSHNPWVRAEATRVKICHLTGSAYDMKLHIKGFMTVGHTVSVSVSFLSFGTPNCAKGKILTQFLRRDRL